MKEFLINIAGLGNKVHEFRYTVGDAFFEHFGKEMVERGNLEAIVEVNRQETFLDVGITIRGSVVLVCDRSLEPFDFPIDRHGRILFKYADRAEEISEEIIHITRDTESIDLGQLIYEFICTSLPMRKIHPKFKDESEDEEGGIIYQTGDPTPPDVQDPRWEKLKDLKFK